MIRVVNVAKLRTKAARATVVYCGRAFAGWPRSRWCNPHSKHKCADPLAAFQAHLDAMPPAELDRYLAELWEACERGKKPLGCWCCDCVVGDGSPEVCHCQLLGQKLLERFASAEVG
jgi:hypothetical protein